MTRFLELTIVLVAVCVICVLFTHKLKAEKKASSDLLEEQIKVNAWLDEDNKITVKFSTPVKILDAVSKFSVNNDKKINMDINEINPLDKKNGNASLYNIITVKPLRVNNLYMLKYSNKEPVQIIPRKVLDQGSYFYNGNDLGCVYAKDKTVFKLWAPTAVKINTLIFDSYANDTKFFSDNIVMKRNDNGLWRGESVSDLKGKYYLYKIELYENGKLITNYVVDPYSKATGPNCLKTFIFDPEEVNSKIQDWNNDKYVMLENNVDAVIYEMHVRDYTISETSGIKQEIKGKYSGLAEFGSKTKDGLKTGIDNIVELGITHVHLLPTYDYGTGDEVEVNDLYTWYNWGYDPVLYFNPEGSYSTYPNGIERLIEYKKMVQAFHSKDIGVVQDIVFNHTFQTGNEKMSIFDKIVPMYFYRVRDNGEYANGSYCGNEVASERPMVRKYIIDNLKYWAEEFHIDGYRFDLMGLIDKETLTKAFAEVKKINPDTIFYGEGWNMGDILPVEEKMIQKNVANTGIAAFNDGIRDNLKGDVFDDKAKGFVQDFDPMTGINRLKDQIKAQDTGRDKLPIPVLTPNETVNYVCCHDNLTIWDKLVKTDPEASYDEIKRMDMLAFAVVITSQGIPFFGEGDEFGRTKKGVENSYNNNDPNVNPINWELKKTNSDMFEFYKTMIQLRKEHPAFRMTSKTMIDKNLKFINTPEDIIAYTIENNAIGDDWNTIFVAFNSGEKEYELKVDGDWNVVVNGKKAGTKAISKMKDTLILPAEGALIAYKD